MKNKNRRVELKRRTRAVRMSMEASLRASASASAVEGASSSNDADGDAGDPKHDGSANTEEDIDAAAAAAATADMRNALKMKLKAKAFRNIEASIKQIHLRCEVSEGALSDTEYPQMKGTAGAQTSAADRAFTFGCTLDSFVVRTATPSWETGECIFYGDGDTTRGDDEDAAKESAQPASVGFGPGTGPTYKVVELNGIRMYWDFEPAFLVTETDALRDEHRIPPHKVQKRIADAMEVMVDAQDPGNDIREALSLGTAKKIRDSSVKSSRKRTGSVDGETANAQGSRRQHEYCCSPFNLMFRATFSDIAQEGPSQWEAELLPFELQLYIQPHQYQQYQRLRSVMIAQKKIDTMQHRRPDASPADDPIAWWRYTVGRVVARPNARPWRDVLQIVNSRSRYIELVVKKLKRHRDGVGFHGGLKDDESHELLALEDALPIESLLSFHLLALRDIYRQQTDSGEYLRQEETLNSLLSASDTAQQKHRSSLIRMTRKMTGRASKQKSAFVIDKSSASSAEDVEMRSDGNTALPSVSTSLMSGMDYSSVPLSSPDDSIIQIKFIVRQMLLGISLVDPESNEPFVTLEFDADGSMYSSGMRVHIKEVALDLRRVSVDSCEGKILSIGSGKQEEAACRLMASRDVKSLALGVSARPATLVWNNTCFHQLLSFLSAKGADDFQNMVKSKLRSAATPLAYKARVAILSPKAMSVEMKIEAPKVWIPISSSIASDVAEGDTQAIEGAIFFDAGLLRFSLSKGEGVADTLTVASISQINVRYCERITGFMVDDQGFIVPRLSAAQLGATRDDITVVRPFSISVDASVAADYEKWDGTISSLVDQIDTSGRGRVTTSIAVTIGDIYFDLVDAGIITRAVGKLYAAEVLRAKQRASYDVHINAKPEVGASATVRYLSSNSLILTVTLDRIRAALVSRAGDSERRYILQLCSLKVRHATLFDEKLTRFGMTDASIHRKDSQLKVFGRPQITSVTESGKSKDAGDDNFIRASFLANRRENMNEFELDIKPLVLVVTPSSLVDCMHSIKGIAEVGEIIGREVERRVHLLGRSTRIRRAISSDASPRASSRVAVAKTGTSSITAHTSAPNKTDSTLVLCLTMDTATILMSSAVENSSSKETERGTPAQSSLQVVSNALVMFQSIENDDEEATGSKTLHLSLDDFSASLTDANESPQRVLDPSALEFRVVYATQNHGSVVSQDFSLHGNTAKSYASPSSILALKSIGENMSRVLSGRQEKHEISARHKGTGASSRKQAGIGSLIQYQKSGTGIATSMKWELDSISCAISRPCTTSRSACGDEIHLFNVVVDDVKGSLDGCVSALYGDVNASFSIIYFRPDSHQWDSVVEPFHLNMTIEQMPNEIVSLSGVYNSLSSSILFSID